MVGQVYQHPLCLPQLFPALEGAFTAVCMIMLVKVRIRRQLLQLSINTFTGYLYSPLNRQAPSH